MGWIMLVPVAGVACSLAGSRGATTKGVMVGFAIAGLLWLGVAIDIGKSDTAWDAASFWLFSGLYGAWLGGGIDAIRKGYKKTGNVCLIGFAAFVVWCLSLWD